MRTRTRGYDFGVTRSIANPAYRRLEQYEPWLRLAVPALLALFLADARRERLDSGAGRTRRDVIDAINDIDVIATLSAVKLAAVGARRPQHAAAASSTQLARGCRPARLRAGRTLVLADAAGHVLATYPPLPARAATLVDLLGETQPLDALHRPSRRHDDQARRGASTASRPCARCPHDRADRASCSRFLASSPAGRRAPSGRSRLLAAAIMVLRRHRHRLRHAGEPRPRRGRGLREGPRPHRFRAQPRPLRTVGLGHRARADLLVRFHVRAPRLRAPGRVHVLRRGQRDGPSGAIRTSSPSRTSSPPPRPPCVDHEFRIRSSAGEWVWLRARAELMSDPDDDGRHLVGICRRRDRAARPRGAHRSAPTPACATPSRRSRRLSYSGMPATDSCSAIRSSSKLHELAVGCGRAPARAMRK